MSEIKYSRQREAIIQELCRRKDHPTADDLYASVRSEYPHISLGTVYRNLNQLAQSGRILCIAREGCPVRFDGNASAHYHLACTRCGRVLDVEMPVQEDLDALAARASGAKVEDHSILFTGICAHCLAERVQKG